jgi:cardiolipin synthase
MKLEWIGGNHLRLLENGEEFFPAVFGAIENAQREVLIETFILFEDKVGLELQRVLIAAAQRGVRVELTMDGYGCAGLSKPYVAALADAGVHLHFFDPQPNWLRRLRAKPFHRLHRKLVVIDSESGFVGGINYSADHLLDFGPQAKQDYAVQVQGPVVQELRRAALQIIAPAHGGRAWFRRRQAEAPRAPALQAKGEAQALLAIRDNHDHRDDIERHYRLALHGARREILIANAYFFPGYRLLHALRRAAQRGVQVRLILQGEPDMAWVAFTTRMLYDHLLSAGVEVYEYCQRPMHGKVALVDDEWATVGSSNLEPLSLSLNFEANLVVRDRGFNRELRERLEPLLRDHCRRIEVEHTAARRWWWRLGVGYFVFHLLRHFPAWASRLPARPPRVAPAAEAQVVGMMGSSRGWHAARAFGLGFIALVLALLAWQASKVQWTAVFAALRDYAPATLALAAVLAAASHLLYSGYDLLGRAWIGHRLALHRVMLVTFVSYAFNLNMGTLVGGFAFRFRLYSRLGLRPNEITRVLGLSLATNWLGYGLLAGGVFALRILQPPPGWPGAAVLQALGLAMWAIVAGYLLCCALLRERRSFTIRGHTVTLPPARMALAQLALSCANWLTIGCVLYVLLHGQIGYGSVLGTLLVAAVAGVITHIPAGLGVLEAVFVALLGARLDTHMVLAALLAYRALYYLVPLLLATGVYFMLESRAKTAA